MRSTACTVITNAIATFSSQISTFPLSLFLSLFAVEAWLIADLMYLYYLWVFVETHLNGEWNFWSFQVYHSFFVSFPLSLSFSLFLVGFILSLRTGGRVAAGGGRAAVVRQFGLPHGMGGNKELGETVHV